MKAVYCDTSVIVPLFMSEATSAAVELWADDERIAVVISSWVAIEFSSAVARHVREQSLTSSAAKTTIAAFGRWSGSRRIIAAIEQATAAKAKDLVERFELGLRAPDALHLALAGRERPPLCTLDGKLRAAAATLGIEIIDIPLDRP